MFNKGQLAGLMKQAQAMQDKMEQQKAKIREDLANQEVVGEAGAGLVKVTMNGNSAAKRVSIDPSLLSDDKDMLEDLVVAAVNDAYRKATALSEEKMGGIAAGMGMPPGFKMPF